MHSHNSLIWLAVALFLIWIVLRVALAFTNGFLHLLWIGAMIFAVVWLFRHFTGHHAPRG